MKAARRPDGGPLLREAMAGLPGAIGSVPDGMAASVLAGVSPIHGLYASFVGPLFGGISSSTQLMVVTTTSAAALAAGSTLVNIPAEQRAGALALLTLLAGLLMVVAGVARLGRYVRFVAFSVMIGFLTGVAFNIILGQLSDLTGVASEGSVALTRAVSVLRNLGQTHPATLLLGLIALGIMAAGKALKRESLSALVALIIPAAIVALAGLDDVAVVSDRGVIPTGVPLPALPDFRSFSLDLLVGALAVAVIVLVQGSGVGEAVPNLDGSPSDVNRDFLAQGFGNVAAGFFRGQPVGGSVGQTALNVSAGARSRWAAIFSGAWMLLILVFFAPAVSKVVMSSLAAVLIWAAVNAIRPDAIRLTLRTGPESQIAMITTFIATLLLPVAAAVGIGVALSLLLQLNREALDLRVTELRPDDGGRFVEYPAPARLDSGVVVLLDIYGSLLFAGARTLEMRLPDPAGSNRAAVVLRLRGRTSLSTTAVQVLARYAQRLEASGGRLYLSGVDPSVAQRVGEGHTFDVLEGVEVETATAVLGESSLLALEKARAWLASGEGH